MTIRKKLFISFSLILAIIIFIIGIFFYTTYNLNNIHILQNQRYEQIRKVEKLKEYNSNFAWIVLDVITDKDKEHIVLERLNKANTLFKELFLKEVSIISFSETKQEKENIKKIYINFTKLQTLIENELYDLVEAKKDGLAFKKFNDKFNITYQIIDKLLIEEIAFLQDRLDKTEQSKDKFVDKIKIEMIVLLFIAFSLSFIISSRLISDIKVMLSKLNDGVLQLLSNNENTIKIDIGKNNELTQIMENFNSCLHQKEDIIKSREELLRNISHELKTPITKGKFLLEKLKTEQDKTIVQNINNVFFDIEELTSKLLQREKLNHATLKRKKFKATTLILEALSKLSIDDESKIELQIDDDFTIEADFYYLTIVLKNLIDNAMKYSINYPIKIIASNNTLYVQNEAKKLSHSLIYYLQPFTREPNQQLGHGLGLNIVNKILQLHSLELEYNYKSPYNSFYIKF